MIWSDYNVIFTSNKKEKTFLYNSLYNVFVEIEPEKVKKIKQIKSDLKSKKDVKKWTDDEDFDFLLTNNIITTKENESAYKKMLYIKKKMQISDPTIRGYTIAPTLDCNFNCEYCFEESRPPIYMDEKTEKAIIEMIKNDSRIRILHIDWYGGEPLMGFDIIERISKEILTIKNIQYSASIITNGYLLTEEKIKKLKELRVTDIQVTIDGDRETHNKKRPHIKGFGTYDVIIENLKNFIMFILMGKLR